MKLCRDPKLCFPSWLFPFKRLSLQTLSGTIQNCYCTFPVLLRQIGGGCCSDQVIYSEPMVGLGGSQRRGRPIVLRQLLLWWLNSPWAPGHICGVSAMLVVVVVLLFFGSRAGTRQIRDQFHALEDRNDSNNSLEVYTPNSFIHLFYNSPYMDVVDMHNVLITPSDSVL